MTETTDSSAPATPGPVAAPTYSGPPSGVPAMPTQTLARRAGGNFALAVLAFALASGALALGLVLLHRSDALTQRLERALADDAARDQAGVERERRLADLERQWAQARSDGEIGTGVVADAEVRKRREQLAMLDIERLVEQVQLQLRLGTPRHWPPMR